MLYIKRLLTKRLKKVAKTFPVILITGPRQSGKTTLAKHVFKDYTYISLENIDTRNLVLQDPKGFLENIKTPVILDEIQYVPNLLSYLQEFVDNSDTPGQYILTGSNNILLMEQVTQSLAGRVSILNLLPLTIQEILNTPPLSQLTHTELIYKGGYPRVYKHNIDPKEFYSSYITTYLERDIRLLRQVEDIMIFRNLLTMLATRVGNIINTSEIATLLGISHTNIKDWVNILAISFLVFYLEPYTKSMNKRITKSPRLYFLDTGLLSHLLEVPQNHIFTSPYYGQLFENLIVADIYKYFATINPQVKLSFWKDYKGHEVDLIVSYQNKTWAFEIKGAYTFHTNFVRHLDYFKSLNPNVQTGVIYAGDINTVYKRHTVINYRQIYELLDKEFNI